MLQIFEIYKSLQGESSYAGLPCIFVRLTGCNLRCSYCDTEQAFVGGSKMSVEEVLAEVKRLGGSLVEITGGEPLLQAEVNELMAHLCEMEYRVLLETSGGVSLEPVPEKVHVIMDIKCPSSGESGELQVGNIERLKHQDEVKFVMADRYDYDWSVNAIKEFDLPCSVLFSPVHGVLDPKDLAQWILDDQLNVRMQIQQHKYIWGDDAEGV